MQNIELEVDILGIFSINNDHYNEIIVQND